MKLGCFLRSSAICSSLGANAKQRSVKASGKALQRHAEQGGAGRPGHIFSRSQGGLLFKSRVWSVGVQKR